MQSHNFSYLTVGVDSKNEIPYNKPFIYPEEIVMSLTVPKKREREENYPNDNHSKKIFTEDQFQKQKEDIEAQSLQAENANLISQIQAFFEEHQKFLSTCEKNEHLSNWQKLYAEYEKALLGYDAWEIKLEKLH